MFPERQLENESLNGENNMYNHQIDQLSKKELVEYIHEINRQFDEYRKEQGQQQQRPQQRPAQNQQPQKSEPEFSYDDSIPF